MVAFPTERRFGYVRHSSKFLASVPHSSPPRIAAFDINHFARIEDGSKVQHKGILGKESWSARQNDLVTLDLKLSRPAYSYLLAFRPDGVIELCYPDQDDVRPPLSAVAGYPLGAARRSEAYGLRESSGLWVFTAVVSETPLPAYREWIHSLKLPSLNHGIGIPGVVLMDDGQTIDQLYPTGHKQGERGKGEKIPGQDTLESISNSLRQSLPDATLLSIGVLAEPESR